MPTKRANPKAPALSLFPLFDTYSDMVKMEIGSLNDAQLDWTSPNWRWSEWSARDNVSHVASHLFRWYILRWGSQLFPQGIPYFNEVHYLAGLPTRRLDAERWGSKEEILKKLDEGIAMIKGALSKETVRSVTQKYLKMGTPSFYSRISERYDKGRPESEKTLRQDPNDPSIWYLTLEGNIHHSEGEMVTHLYNVQRLKKAQRLASKVKLPEIGYWTLPGWDRSEP